MLGSGSYQTNKIVELTVPGTPRGVSSVNIFGVQISLQSVDRRANTAVFSWQAAASPDEVVVVPTSVFVTSR